MNKAQFRRLLSAYGGHLSGWPEDVRSDAALFLKEHAEAERWLQQEQLLDRALDTLTNEVTEPTSAELALLRENIVRRVTAGSQLDSNRSNSRGFDAALDQFINWIWPQSLALGPLMRSVTAAGLPLVIGVVLGANMMSPTQVSADVESDEIYLIALVDDIYASDGADEMENSL